MNALGSSESFLKPYPGNRGVASQACSPRLLLVMQDLVIGGRTRVQKYGFLIYKQYWDEVKECGFYSDWKPHNFGPYSPSLAEDLAAAVQEGYVEEETDSYNGSTITKYRLTIRGTTKYRSMLKDRDFMNQINEMLRNQQNKSLMSILKQIYRDYPEYTIYSQIKETINT